MYEVDSISPHPKKLKKGNAVTYTIAITSHKPLYLQEQLSLLITEILVKNVPEPTYNAMRIMKTAIVMCVSPQVSKV
jgi:hypothetical protein